MTSLPSPIWCLTASSPCLSACCLLWYISLDALSIALTMCRSLAYPGIGMYGATAWRIDRGIYRTRVGIISLQKWILPNVGLEHSPAQTLALSRRQWGTHTRSLSATSRVLPVMSPVGSLKEWPRPPWPMSSKVVRLIQLNTSKSITAELEPDSFSEIFERYL